RHENTKRAFGSRGSIVRQSWQEGKASRKDSCTESHIDYRFRKPDEVKICSGAGLRRHQLGVVNAIRSAGPSSDQPPAPATPESDRLARPLRSPAATLR